MGGFEVIRQCIINNKEQAEADRQEESYPTEECPYDAWPLNVNDKGQKSCPICGWVWG